MWTLFLFRLLAWTITACLLVAGLGIGYIVYCTLCDLLDSMDGTDPGHTLATQIRDSDIDGIDNVRQMGSFVAVESTSKRPLRKVQNEFSTADEAPIEYKHGRFLCALDATNPRTVPTDF